MILDFDKRRTKEKHLDIRFVCRPRVHPNLTLLHRTISFQLGQTEAAAGLLKWGKKNLEGDLKVQERWYEKLHEWDKALAIYHSKSVERPEDADLILGRMRCLDALGEWADLHELSAQAWPNADIGTRHKMARMAAHSAWGQADWKAMETYTSLLPRESQDGAFCRAVLCVHKQQWTEAQEFIDLAREMFDTEVPFFFGAQLDMQWYSRFLPKIYFHYRYQGYSTIPGELSTCVPHYGLRADVGGAGRSHGIQANARSASNYMRDVVSVFPVL